MSWKRRPEPINKKKKKKSKDMHQRLRQPIKDSEVSPSEKKPVRSALPHLNPFYCLRVLMVQYTNGSSRSSSSQPSIMESQPPVSQRESQPPASQQDSSTNRQYRDASRHGSLSVSQLTDDYTETQMEQDMEIILDEVTATRRSRANGSSSADGDSADSERPAKRQ